MATTCQVCGRAIKAASGLIAHHGYKRPYQAGWQTSSCEGARYVPYEVSCDRLREVVGMVQSFIAGQEEALTKWLATPPRTITVIERRSSYRDGTPVDYTRPDVFERGGYRSRIPRTYECAYEDRLIDYERTIRMAKADLLAMERRLNEWSLQVVAIY